MHYQESREVTAIIKKHWPESDGIIHNQIQRGNLDDSINHRLGLAQIDLIRHHMPHMDLTKFKRALKTLEFLEKKHCK